MVPTGEVTEVQIVESSGNGALDRSAEQAVWKVTKFPVPKDSVLFEKQFRKFLIKLKPENARL
jgi:colicin import membrane protein